MRFFIMIFPYGRILLNDNDFVFLGGFPYLFLDAAEV